MTRRREFMIQISAGSAALLAGRFAMAADMVAETDPQAGALGYKAESSKVDAKKYPTHAATQNCGNCALFQGKAGDKAGMCPLFAGKQVSAAAWCSAYAKKG
jgi:formylmethanofuran:tetrahydromethanopterin formyltransferase